MKPPSKSEFPTAVREVLEALFPSEAVSIEEKDHPERSEETADAIKPYLFTDPPDHG